MERKYLGYFRDIRADLVDHFNEEKRRRDIKSYKLMEEILQERYIKETPQGKIPIHNDENMELKEIINSYRSTSDERLKTMELKRVRHIVNKSIDTKRILYQHRRQDEGNLPYFIKETLEEDFPDEVLYETLVLIQRIFKRVMDDPKERELWYKDIFPYLTSILENEHTKADILEQTIWTLGAMTDEKGDLSTVKVESRRRPIDILRYMFDIQKRCSLWPEYKGFLEFDARSWKKLYVDKRTEKDLGRLRKLIYANMDKAPEHLQEVYIAMLDRINYRLDNVLKNPPDTKKIEKMLSQIVRTH